MVGSIHGIIDRVFWGRLRTSARALGLICFWLCGIAMGTTAAAEQTDISGRPMGACLVDASNTAAKLRPSFHLNMIHLPTFERTFDDKDEVGQSITVARFNGRIDAIFAGRKVEQLYSCTFWKDAENPWTFSWSGLGATHVEGFR